MKTLTTLTQHLQTSDLVDAVFLTGSHGTHTNTSSSDIDLVIILKENPHHIRSVYELIDDVFADIFFFDIPQIQKLISKTDVSGNSLEEGILISWLAKGTLLFDKSGITTQLKERTSRISQKVPDQEKFNALQNVSYNMLGNKRYFSSSQSIYHEALQIRLMHSVIELITAFLTLRDEPWQGEKHAISFLKQTDPLFYELFTAYQITTTLKEKMALYEKMAQRVPPDGTLFSYNKPVCQSSTNDAPQIQSELQNFWSILSSGDNL